MKKPFLSRREQYLKAPTLRNRSLLLAQALDALKNDPIHAEFKKILHRAIIETRELGRLDKREKRARVIKSLQGFACELGEIKEETKLERKDILKVLRILHRAKLIVLTRRPHFHNEDGDHGSTMFVWHEHYHAKAY